jgi:hypothetical protein
VNVGRIAGLLNIEVSRDERGHLFVRYFQPPPTCAWWPPKFSDTEPLPGFRKGN